MSEPPASQGDLRDLALLILIVVAGFVFVILIDRSEVRDLQRRVGQLEQQARR